LCIFQAMLQRGAATLFGACSVGANSLGIIACILGSCSRPSKGIPYQYNQ
jgi:hypothetical protein